MNATSELAAVNGHGLQAAGLHPDEMKASVHVQLGAFGYFQATARTTPAGIVAVALLVAVSAGAGIWAMRLRA